MQATTFSESLRNSRLPPGWAPAHPQVGVNQKNSAHFRDIIRYKVRILLWKSAAKKSAFLAIFLLTMFETTLKYQYVCQQANMTCPEPVEGNRQ